MRTRALDRVLAQDRHDRRARWQSAMLWTKPVGSDMFIGVTKGLELSVLTLRDSTTVPDPAPLLVAVSEAISFVRQSAEVTVGGAMSA